MENNAQINTFQNGMDMDTDLELLSEGKYRYAENIRIITDSDGTTGALQNIEYIRQYNNGIPSDETILGTSSSRWYKDGNVKECGIVLTKKSSENKILNKLYVVDGFESINIQHHVVFQAYLDITKEVCIVTNYEGPTVSKVYISDSENPIKSINIQNTYSDIISDKTFFDIVPGAVLAPFKLQQMVSGTLPAGMVQYCYQLFTKNGTESTTSPLSQKIPTVSTSIDSKKTLGYEQNTITDKGCRLKAKAIHTGNFNKIRIISIHYLSNIDTPRIYIISEYDIPSNRGVIDLDYVDNGGGFIRELTIEEFNNIIPYEFKAKTIEKLDNRLFAANVEEITWDVEYDARAYRANKKGTVKLNSISNEVISASQSEIVTGTKKIPEYHDCINPMNDSLLYPLENSDDEYAWVTTDGNAYRGGIGPNVSYRFIVTDLVESDQTPVAQRDGSKLATYDLELNCEQTVDNIISFKYPEGGITGININQDNVPRVRNYSDPYYVSNFLSYQRDEIYRFGIIMYNNKNIPTPVHWIGDVRFPSPDVSGYAPFTFDGTVDESGKYEMISHPIGIEFKVNNLPPEVKAYEIVRCERKLSDRTVITQGLLNKTMNFKGWKGDGEYDAEVSSGAIDRRPYVIPTFASNPKFKQFFVVEGLSGNTDPVDESGVFDFVSSDVCFNKTQEIIQQGDYIVPIYCASSAITVKQTMHQHIQNRLYNVGGVQIGGIKNTTEYWDNQYFGTVVNLNGTHYFVDGIKNVDESESKTEYYPIAGLIKPYVFKNKSIATNNGSSTRQAYLIEDSKVTTNIPAAIVSGIKDIKNNYIDYIGNYAYTNLSIGEGFGPHGISTAIYSPSVYNSTINYAGVTPEKDPYHLTTVLYVNIKRKQNQYGGNNYSNRQNSIYISTGCYVKRDLSGYENGICFGGDTYLGTLDYAHTMFFNINAASNPQNLEKRYVAVYIPLESSINVYHRNDKHFAYDTIPSAEQYKAGYANVYYMTEPGQLNTKYVQNTPMYNYNSAYSSSNGSKKYIPKSLYYIDNQINSNRITCSEVKTNNELIDSWTKFKFANYLDVDSQYGQITNLKAFNNKLYFFQDESVGIASVNDRSLITDNNASQLVLGTGTILSRYDYVVVGNGDSQLNDKSITQSVSTMYWFDFDKNVICAINNSFMELSKGFMELSKVRNVQTYLNRLPKLSKQDAVSFFDSKYNEVWFRLYDKSLIFNEQTNNFTSFYTHNPNWFFPFSDKLVTIKGNNMYYLHNLYEVNSEQKEERISKVQFVVNKDASMTKVFDNVQFSAKLLDNDNQLPQIITDAHFNTKNQITDKVDYNNIDYREDNYRFSIPRVHQDNPESQTIINKSYANRMRGKYLICDYTFDCNNGREMKIPFIKTMYRYSML